MYHRVVSQCCHEGGCVTARGCDCITCLTCVRVRVSGAQVAVPVAPAHALHVLPRAAPRGGHRHHGLLVQRGPLLLHPVPGIVLETTENI